MSFTYSTFNFKYTNKLALFDLDDTLVSKSNVVLPNVLNKLNELNKNKYTILIISNQKGISTTKLNTRFTLLESILTVPFKAFCAQKKDKFRKPDIGIFNLIQKESNLSSDFYVGDASGREGDHSDCDLQFAKNCNLRFYTPEEYFAVGDIINMNHKFPPHSMLLLIGYPASGKSTYANSLENVVVCNNDTQKTKSVKICEQALKNNQSVVIDNLNSTIKSRSKFINLAKKYNYPINIIIFNKSYSYCIKKNEERGEEKLVPTVVFNTFRKKFELPTKEEYDNIFTIL